MACCYVLSRWDRRGGASVTRQAPSPDSEGCGAAVAAAVAETVALRARRERWSQPCSPWSPSTPEQPSPALARPGSLPPGIGGDLKLGSRGRGALSAPVRAVRPGDGPGPALHAARHEAVLSRSRGGSPKVPGVLGAGSVLLRPRDRFVYKHWRALRVRDLLVTKSSPANTGTQRPGRHRLPCSA